MTGYSCLDAVVSVELRLTILLLNLIADWPLSERLTQSALPPLLTLMGQFEPIEKHMPTSALRYLETKSNNSI